MQFLNKILGLLSILIILCKYKGGVGCAGDRFRGDVPSRERLQHYAGSLILQLIILSHPVFAFWCVTMTTVITSVLCECTFLLENNLVGCMSKLLGRNLIKIIITMG